MSYKTKIWLSKQNWFQSLVKWYRNSECGHIDTCRLACARFAPKHIEDDPNRWISLRIKE